MRVKANILKVRAGESEQLLRSCRLCGHRCGVDRTSGDQGIGGSGGQGICGAGRKIKVASYTAHFGEEPFISGEKGSGTIFFSHCNMLCVYCQNHEISHEALGLTVTGEELADMMMKLQDNGCHNINLVTPTHYMPQILGALVIALEKGLKLPLVYNSNGYDSMELLTLLDGVIDIYMPDIKYSDNKKALTYSNTPNYVEVSREGIKEMYRQAGDLVFDENEVALQGLLVRHLVLPNGISDTKKALKYLSTISKNMWISIMSQYSPQFRAKEFKEMDRKINKEEYFEAIECAQELGLENYLIQELSSSETYLPDFKREEPFKESTRS